MIFRSSINYREAESIAQQHPIETIYSFSFLSFCCCCYFSPSVTVFICRRLRALLMSNVAESVSVRVPQPVPVHVTGLHRLEIQHTHTLSYFFFLFFFFLFEWLHGNLISVLMKGRSNGRRKVGSSGWLSFTSPTSPRYSSLSLSLSLFLALSLASTWVPTSNVLWMPCTLKTTTTATTTEK